MYDLPEKFAVSENREGSSSRHWNKIRCVVSRTHRLITVISFSHIVRLSAIIMSQNAYLYEFLLPYTQLASL